MYTNKCYDSDSESLTRSASSISEKDVSKRPSVTKPYDEPSVMERQVKFL